MCNHGFILQPRLIALINILGFFFLVWFTKKCIVTFICSVIIFWVFVGFVFQLEKNSDFSIKYTGREYPPDGLLSGSVDTKQVVLNNRLLIRGGGTNRKNETQLIKSVMTFLIYEI